MRGERIQCRCSACGKKFEMIPSHHRRRVAQTKSGDLFCSPACVNAKKAKEADTKVKCHVCKKRWTLPANEAARGTGRKFCSNACKKKGRARKKVSRKCKGCGKEFNKLVRYGRANRYCSFQCFSKNGVKSSSKEYQCQHCAKPVKRKPSERKKLKKVFCSRPCYRKWDKERLTKELTRKCVGCGSSYVCLRQEQKKSRRYCSPRCYLTNKGETLPERSVRLALKKRSLNASRNRNPLVRFTFPDFLFPKPKLCIFVDGDYWHRKPEVKEKDKLQDKVLRAAGYRVVRIKEKDANDEKKLERILTRIFK